MRALLSGRTVLAVAACVLASLALTALGAATSLPGGTSFDVTITSDAGPVQPTGPVTVHGTSSVGTGVATANTALIYVLDLSGSTSTPVAGATCGNRNAPYDLTPNTRLDCELDAAETLNDLAISKGTVAKVGVIAFGGALQTIGRPVTDNAKSVDLDPTGGMQQFIAPNAGPASPNTFFTQAMSSAFLDSLTTIIPATLGNGFDHFTHIDVGSNTNYWAAISRLKVVLADPTISPLTKQVVFISDGDATEGSGTSSTLAQLMVSIDPAVHIDSFAIGGGTCTTSSPYGDLQDIAGQPGLTPIRGTCTQVTNIALLPSILPNAVTSQLTALTVQADSGPSVAGAVTPALPQNGPTSVNWTRTITGLSAGLHHICAAATGKDGGGTSTTQACTDVTLKDPPTVTLDGGDGAGGSPAGSVPEGSPFTVGATVAGATTTSWSSSGGTGTCSFGDPSSASTAVTCTDDGLYTLTLTVSDGVNVPVSASEHLDVTNVAPTPTLTVSASPHQLSQPVVANVTIADPGADTFDCLFDWADGSTSGGAATGATCQGTHTYADEGAYLVGVTVTDDNHDSGAAAATVRVDAPPAIDLGGGGGGGLGLSGVEGSPVVLGASVADTTAGLTLHWSATPGPGVDAGATCAFGNDAQAATTVTCTDDGDWQLTLTADDHVNPAVSGSVGLHLTNVNPTLSLGATVSALTATVTGTVHDAGANDSLTCSFSWGDGSPDTTGVVVSGGTCVSSHAYAAGTHGSTVTVTASDDDGGTATRSLAVTLNRPPSCTAAAPSVGELWPPDHTLRLVVLGGAIDPDGDALTYAVTSVRQDEPTNGLGDGDTAIDAVNAGAGSVRLRAERSGNGDGRVYTIAFTVSDGKGGSCAGSVQVTVPKSASKPAVLTSGPGYDSFH